MIEAEVCVGALSVRHLRAKDLLVAGQRNFVWALSDMFVAGPRGPNAKFPDGQAAAREAPFLPRQIVLFGSRIGS